MTPYERAQIWGTIETNTRILQNAVARQNLEETDRLIRDIQAGVLRIQDSDFAEALREDKRRSLAHGE